MYQLGYSSIRLSGQILMSAGLPIKFYTLDDSLMFLLTCTFRCKPLLSTGALTAIARNHDSSTLLPAPPHDGVDRMNGMYTVKTYEKDLVDKSEASPRRLYVNTGSASSK